MRDGGGVAFGRVCVVRASAPRRSNVQAGGIAEPQHFGSARVRAASAPRQQQQMQAGARGAFLAAARRRTPVFICALVRRLRNVLGMTNRPSLQRETTANSIVKAGRTRFFTAAEVTEAGLARSSGSPTDWRAWQAAFEAVLGTRTRAQNPPLRRNSPSAPMARRSHARSRGRSGRRARRRWRWE